MSPLALFLLVSCLLSVHASNARCLGVSIGTNPSSYKYYLDKNLNNKSSKSLSEAAVHRRRDNNSPKKEHADQVETKADYKQFTRDLLVGLRGEHESDKGTSGNDDHASAIIQERSKSLKERSIMESSNEETIDSREVDAVDDNTVVMDYAQPHRKPPIHNEEP